MFICQLCKRPSKLGEKLNTVVVEVRDRVYPDGGFGTEIVREVRLCGECHSKKAEHNSNA
jgi:hypothetical protein